MSIERELLNECKTALLATRTSNISIKHQAIIDKIETELAKPDPEPCTNSDNWNCKYCKITKTCKALADDRNFAPPAREPLSDDEMKRLRLRSGFESISFDDFFAIARAIEKDHGIGDL